MRLGKKNSTNLEQLDYLQDLNRLLFSNVVNQADQKTKYYLTYYMGGEGINKPAAAAKSLAYISLLQHLDAFATDVHRHVSYGFNDTNEIGGDFHKSHVNYMVLDFLCNSDKLFQIPI
jgi:hypothetical protein